MIFNFILDHPVIAFFLAWPIGLVIVSVCWSIAAILEDLMNFVLRITNMIVILFRGYAPLEIPNDDDNPPSTT